MERITNFSDETMKRAQELLGSDTEMLHSYPLDGVRCIHCDVSRVVAEYDQECPALLRAALQFTQAKAKPLKMCGACGNRLVEIRGRIPRDPERTVCPTCCAERLDQINNISSRDYGVAFTQERPELIRADTSVRDYDISGRD